mgnify:CR=1 FL=1
MKKVLILLLISSFLLSCNKDFLKEETFGLIRPADFFKTTNDLEKCVNALYSNGNLMYNTSSSLVSSMGGDDITTQAGGNKAGYLQFDVFNAQDNNDRLGDSWKGAYSTIKQSNVIITNINSFTDPKDQPEMVENLKKRAMGQAHFFRALAYFNLVRIFGEVPIVIDLSIDYNVKKAPFADIYALIIADLTKAETLLPVNYNTATNASALEKATAYARPTVGSTKALMASVYLSMAGYPLKDASKYALAAQKAKEVIDNEGVYGYMLLTNYGDLWKHGNSINKETVFGCYYNQTAGNWSDGGTVANGNMNGPLSFFPENFGGWSDAFAELTFFNEFPEGPRKDATFLTFGQKTPTSPVITWKDFSHSRPHFAKYIDVPGFNPLNMGAFIDWWSARSVQVIRYAEVLLVYAEAQARTGAPDALAYASLNRVRSRAGLADAPTGLSGAAFADLVVTERKWEFAGLEPCTRWYDMVRTETVESATAKRHPTEIPIVNQPTKARYFSPIPQADRLLNPNL